MLGRPGLGAAFNEVGRDGPIEVRLPDRRGVENVPGEPAVSGGRFDEIDARRPRLSPPGSRQRRAKYSASNMPNTGPTSTLVKKSPVRPDRWDARA